MSEKTDFLEIGYAGQFRPRGLILHNRKIPDARAVFAMQVIERWGMVAAIEDGEDSAGRQKLRLATISELVERAVQVSAAAFELFESRAWIVDTPDFATVVDRAREADERN